MNVKMVGAVIVAPAGARLNWTVKVK